MGLLDNFNIQGFIENQGQQVQNQATQQLISSISPNMFSHGFGKVDQQIAPVGIAQQATLKMPDSLELKDLSSGGGNIKGGTGGGGSSFTDRFQNSKWGQTTNIIGGALASIYEAIPTMDKVHNSNDELAGTIRGKANQFLLQSGNPYMMAAGAINTVIDKTGGFSDASRGLGGGNDALNFAASLALPGAGWFTKKTDNYKVSDTLATSSGYTGQADKGATAEQNAGAKILFGRSKAQSMIADAKMKDNMISDIIGDNRDRFAASNYYGTGARTQMALNGGLRALSVGKKGMKFETPELKWAETVLAQKGTKLPKKQRTLDELVQYAESVNPNFVSRMKEDSLRTIKHPETGEDMSHMLGYFEQDGKTYVFPQVQEIDGQLKYFEDWKEAAKSAKERNDFLEMTQEEAEDYTKNYKSKYPSFSKYITKHESGGKMNVIPTGSLHAHLHHMDRVDEQYGELTNKGIPVVTEENGGLVQQAEIERNEIIFNLDVTKKLEELAKKGTDEAAIEAGKLLVHEILENTIDNTGLLKEVQ